MTLPKPSADDDVAEGLEEKRLMATHTGDTSELIRETRTTSTSLTPVPRCVRWRGNPKCLLAHGRYYRERNEEIPDWSRSIRF